MAVTGVRIKKDESIKSLHVLVGVDPTVPFSVHEGLIRDSSNFFDKVMSSDWKESSEGSFSLPEEDPETFEIYLHWLYNKKLPVKTVNQCNAEYLALAKAVVLGDKLQDSDFENAVIDAIIDKSRRSGMDGGALDTMAKHIYENTVEGFKTRRLCVEFYMSLRESRLPRDPPPEFALDLLTALSPLRPATYRSNPSTMEDTCKYHNHCPKSSLCYKNKFPGELVTTATKLKKSEGKKKSFNLDCKNIEFKGPSDLQRHIKAS